MVGDQAVIRKCSACELANRPDLHTNCMQGIGPTNVDLMFIGKAPADEDDRIGRPMTGKNGVLFQELLEEAGFSLNEIFIDNCLKCAPGETKLKNKYVDACSGHLKQTLERVKPKAIVSVGAEALSWLTGYSGVKKYRKRGIPCKFDHDILVYSIGQPAQLFHAKNNSEKKKIRQELMEDLYWLKSKSRAGTLTRSGDMVTDHKMVTSIPEFYEVMAELRQFHTLSADIETADVSFTRGRLWPDKNGVISCIGFSGRPGHARSIPLYALGITTMHYWTDEDLNEHILPELKKFLFEEGKVFFGQNFIQFDQKWIKYEFGRDVDSGLIIDFDTMLGGYLLDEEGSNSLEELTVMYTSMPPWKKTQSYKDIVKQCKYNCIDVDATYRVRMAIESELKKLPKLKALMGSLMVPLAQEFYRMESRGIYIDPQAIDGLAKELNDKIESEIANIRSMPEVQRFELVENCTINVGSPDHVALVMEHYLKLPRYKKTGGGAYSTDNEVLTHYQDDPFVAGILQTRGLLKFKGTYCDGMREHIDGTGAIHTSYHATGTVTGRPTSTNPNLANIPREGTADKVLEDGKSIKRMFRARPGYCLLQADYSQIELRVLAMYSGCPVLVQAYRDGKDLHALTAATAHGIPVEQVVEDMRDGAKKINFGIIYGKYVDTLAEELFDIAVANYRKKGKDLDKLHDEVFIQRLKNKCTQEAKLFYDTHKKMHPMVWQYMTRQEETIKAWGFQETFSGRRRHYEEMSNHANRQAYNAPIQSYASDLTEMSMVTCGRIFREYKYDAHLLLTVYDSMIVEVNIDQFWEVADIIKMVMEGHKADHINVPLVAEFKAGPNWGDLRKVDIAKRTIK